MAQNKTKAKRGEILIEQVSIDVIRSYIEELSEEDEGWIDSDWNRYYMAEEGDMLSALAVKVKDHGIVGYSITILASDNHHRDMIVGNNEVLIVHSELRPRLVMAAEKAARNRGAQIMLWHAECCHHVSDTEFSNMMVGMGYKIQSVAYGRKI
jgi:hypothetical protein